MRDPSQPTADAVQAIVILFLVTGCAVLASSVGCGSNTRSSAQTAVDAPVQGSTSAESVSVEKQSENGSRGASAESRESTDAASGQESGETSSDSSGRPSDAAASAPAKPLASRPSASPASKNRIREITFDTIKFDIQKGQPFKREMLTPAIEKLNGQRVRIRGYMLPSFQQSGITNFVLVRDNLECCFGPGAALYDCIIVEMQNGQTCEFSIRPIAVEGVFTIREFKGPDDMHLAIFHLDGERVK